MFSSWRGRSKKNQKRQPEVSKRRLTLERLENRIVLSAMSVTNLNDSGAGSFRQAILDSNQNPGSNVIDFAVTGTISLTSGALPTIADNVQIDGTSAPGYAGTPLVAINFDGFDGLDFGAGSDDAMLQSLSLVGARGAGVTISGANNVVVTGNLIGLALDGSTVNGNTGDGLAITNSTGDVIGGTLTADRNVISGNGANGIIVSGSSGNLIEGNYIGTDAGGTLNRGNAFNGILVWQISTNNTIGGTSGNVISGNDANGVLIDGQSSGNTLSGNTIGLAAGGTAVMGNLQDGVDVLDADNNLIGNSNPVSSTTYNQSLTVPANGGGTMPVSGWQGLRGGDTAGQYIMTGTSDSNGLLFEGTLAGVGTAYAVNYPSASTTSVYGPNNLGSGQLQLVGSYKNADFATAPVTVNGFLYQGTTAGLSNPANYTTIDYPGAKYNYVHSTMGGLAVGNYDSPAQYGQAGVPLGPGHAYVYDIATQSFTSIVYPGSLSNTAYGIWSNGGTSYTIVGGYSPSVANNFLDQDEPIGQAYMVDYDSATGVFSNWTSFSNPAGGNTVTHFQGISSTAPGVYTISADSNQSGSGPLSGSLVTVVRNADGSFGAATWTNLTYSGTGAVPGQETSANSVYGNALMGIVTGGGGSTFSYTAAVNTAFQLSNVISGNGANGIELNAADNNQIAMNFIGTDVTGTVARGNNLSGILVTAGSTNNMIGGESTGGNDPTNGVFVRPPQGNVISGNGGNGVFLNNGATQNQLSGNYIGTTASGNSALGNLQNGVAIFDANANSLIGCNFSQNPFVFYNVISGNMANGLLIKDSNDTTIQANFFGIGADNNTALGNAFSGVFVEGTSTRTTMGGPIPLGNVDAANLQNGIVVQDTASDFTSYNTFTGEAAFSLNPLLGNGHDGMLITTSGTGILIRTNVVGENGNDGIEIGGVATGVQVAGNIIGLNTDGLVPMGNKNNGVEVDGNASGDSIGGPQPTFNIIPQNVISSNGGSGVAIDGAAHNITVNHSYIGLDFFGTAARGNGLSGVFIASGSTANTIGSSDPSLLTVISGNDQNGIMMTNTTGNIVVGTDIGTDISGTAAVGNGGNGIFIGGGSGNAVGSTNNVVPANIIAFNGRNGVYLDGSSQDGVHANSIYGNSLLGINLGNGANNNQVAPVINTVTTVSSLTAVAGVLNSAANATFMIELFASTTSGPTGRYFLGYQLVSTNGAGLGTFSFTGLTLPAGASFITATATDAIQNTSEFSTPAS